MIASYPPVVPSKTIHNSRTKWAKSIPVSRPKRCRNPTLWGGTYLVYSLYPPRKSRNSQGQGHFLDKHHGFTVYTNFKVQKLKELLYFSNLCHFQLFLGNIKRIISHPILPNCWVTKTFMSPLHFEYLKTNFFRNYLVYWVKNFQR